MSINNEIGDKSLRNQVLEQIRATRVKLEADHPELMKTMRRRLMEAQDPIVIAKPEDHTVIDRKKNMASVLKFLELCPNPSLFRNEIKKFIAEQPNV